MNFRSLDERLLHQDLDASASNRPLQGDSMLEIRKTFPFLS